MLTDQILECIVPFIAGAISSGIVLKAKTVGDMVIDTRNPEKDIYSLELGVPPEKFKKCKFVKFRVRKVMPRNAQ